MAFLRAINVGGRRVQMKHLRQLFEGLGFSNVDTYLASGNVVFSASGSPVEHEGRIDAELEDTLEYDVPTFVRSMSELQALAGTSAFDDIVGPSSKQYIVFLESVLGASDERALGDLQSDVDRFAAVGRELVWHRDVDAGESIPTSEVESTLGVVATRRTLTTVQRIVTKYG